MERRLPEFTFDPFQHEALPNKTSIRLLSLGKRRKIGPTASGKPLIECVLHTVDLRDSPAFQALSYCWGNPLGQPQVEALDDYAPRHQWPLAVNGKIFWVRRNLYEALYEFSTPEKHPSTGTNVHERLKPYNKTRLIAAAEKGYVGNVISELKRGADVHAHDCWGETALHYAAENGHLDIVKMLLAHGSRLDLRDDTRRTPLDCCLMWRRGQHKEVAQLLQDPPSIWSSTKEPDFCELEFWVDAVCINQADAQERNAQVALMSEIYKSALSVKIWLGVSSKETAIISSLLQAPAKRLVHGPISPEEADALVALSNRAWFRRKWVIQEVTMAKKLEMVWGSYNLNATAENFSYLQQNESLQQMLSVRAQQGRPIKAIRFTFLMELGQWLASAKSYPDNDDQEPPPSLLWLVANTWQFECSDPRDKIFALVGMAPIAKNSKEDGGHETMVADYSITTADIFIEAGRILIEARGDNEASFNGMEPLQGLSWVQYPRRELHQKLGEACGYNFDRMQGLPSWVPQFHLPLATPPLWDQRFNACGSHSPCKIWDSDRSVLKIDAFRFDPIVRLAENSMGGIDDTFCPNIAGWLQLISWLDVQYHNKCSRVEALWMTLSMDIFQGEDQVKLGQETFNQTICECWSMVEDRQDAMELLEVLRSFEDSCILPSRKAIEAASGRMFRGWDNSPPGFQRQYSSYCHTRDLMQTERGYLGLVSYLAREGDEVWILKGGRVPVVLRPVETKTGETHYKFVCDSFIYGIMSGEAVQSGETAFTPVEIV
ncbi:unnamed protein product [Clonostachys solani]|uniref:Heterokaryon incompatibility domain-containing protein n=1 Tax=Clonostachys solani TaxID=160281 RepID=A0A9N9Z9N0_9HYPO|nr:unnamed protein product [Clonostachys solani]